LFVPPVLPSIKSILNDKFELIFEARGKTNTELREEFVLAAGVSQTMQAFTPRQSISSASPGQVSLVVFMINYRPFVMHVILRYFFVWQINDIMGIYIHRCVTQKY
jgi:hypothetical protein